MLRFHIELKEFNLVHGFSDLKFSGKGSAREAKSLTKKFSKITALKFGEVTMFNENCSVRYWYTFKDGVFKKIVYGTKEHLEYCKNESYV